MYQLPSHISRYEIKTLIGAGGMGSLYLARDTNPNTNRLVALKLLNATLDSGELRERFGREARALAALNHPSIVDIYDSGEFQGSPFIVMEYVRGETLAEKIKRKAPLTLGQKLKLMVELCSGLSHAHEAGIIHRDIKPANLMVDRYGRLKVLDFGIARMTERSTRMNVQMTQLNVRIGTPGYMSPEQIEGGEIDRRSDIFAVGAVFYELLAYREAFSGANTRQVENNVLEGRRARLGSLVPDLDPAIEAIVDNALAKDPQDRYQDAASLEQALERLRWKLGPEDVPAVAARSTPSPARNSGARAHDSRADAAFERSLAVYEEGAVEAARRFAIEALAEDPDNQDARAFIQRLGANLWPPPPPPSAMRTTSAPTMLATGSKTVGAFDDSAATVLSTATPEVGRASADRTSIWARHRKTLQITGIVAAVLVVVAIATFAALYFWPRGPVLTVTRPTGGTVWANGITCGTDASDCTANIPEGETVQLKADPDSGYVFTGFAGDCTKSGRVHMTGARTCVASFSPLPKEAAKTTWTLTITKPANGMVVGPGGIRCGSVDSSCTVEYSDGQEIVLKAFADVNYAFRGFTGDCTAKGEIVMRGARNCGVTFVAEQKAAKVPVSPQLPTPDRSSRSAGRSSRGGVVSDPLPDGIPSSSGLPGATTVDPLRPELPTSADVAEKARPLPPPPLSAEALAKKDIAKVLEEYRDAFERLDLQGIQRAYPGAPVGSLKSAFSGYKSLKFEFQGPPEFVDVDPSRGLAIVKAKSQLTPEVKVGSQPPFRREETFNLELRNGIWVIQTWKQTPLK